METRSSVGRCSVQAAKYSIALRKKDRVPTLKPARSTTGFRIPNWIGVRFSDGHGMATRIKSLFSIRVRLYGDRGLFKRHPNEKTTSGLFHKPNIAHAVYYEDEYFARSGLRAASRDCPSHG